MKIKKNHKALYGNTTIPRAWCSDCKVNALVIDNEKQCCDEYIKNTNFKLKRRLTSPENSRLQLSKKQKDEILNAQNFECYYCDYSLKPYKTHFDHVIPFAYNQNNNSDNIVASCNICNVHKLDKVFDDFDSMKQFIFECRQKRIKPALL